MKSSRFACVAHLANLFALATLVTVALLGTTAHAQPWALGDTLTVIQKPLLNIPSIVLPGGTLEISCAAAPATTGWTASLERGGFNIPLALQSSSYDASTLWWTLTAQVPSVPVLDLYDLRVTANGGLNDVTRQAVKVQAAYPDDFYFVQLTDTHLPTYLYWYESGADADSSNTISLRHIINDVNIINPAFAAITGDFINDGEMEDYLGKRHYSRGQQQLREFRVPVYLIAGNHDIGGWDDTPPPDGTSRRTWWRFFGWKRLDNPPIGAPLRTQNYSFDYGPVHFAAMEVYDNYDGWRFEHYGATSFTTHQLLWLQMDLAATTRDTKVLLYHYDFASQLNLATLGLDMALGGHVHSNREDATAPYNILTDNAGGTNRPFRLVRFANGQLNPRPTLEAGLNGQTLTVDYLPANDGMHNQVQVEIHNGYAERFENGRIQVAMPHGAAGYLVTGGTLAQVDATGEPTVCTIDVDIAAAGTTVVIVELEDTSAVDETPTNATRLLGSWPNPFNPRTEIAFELAQPARCRLDIFDLQGRQVAGLVDGEMAAGTHRVVWEATDAHGLPLPSGVYFAGLRAGDYAETRKLMLVR
ncbi:MAG: metallophosphoesterase [bacterium]|nr:metallophosphoesterase [bacterium]